jgi:diacylglycerol kinase (ATP)
VLPENHSGFRRAVCGFFVKSLFNLEVTVGPVEMIISGSTSFAVSLYSVYDSVRRPGLRKPFVFPGVGTGFFHRFSTLSLEGVVEIVPNACRMDPYPPGTNRNSARRGSGGWNVAVSERPSVYSFPCMRVIVNPKAGRGRGEFWIRKLEAESRIRGLRFDLQATKRPGHATILAEEAVRLGYDPVVAVGGDGTHSEVAQALVGSDMSLGIIAVGTGNDLARSLGLPIGEPGRALEIIKAGKTRWIDVGRDGDRYFVSLLGVGFPAEVAARASEFRRLMGAAAFSLGVYRSIHRMRSFPVDLVLDGIPHSFKATSILLQNTPFTGGGLPIAPEAKLDDGLLDVIVVDDIGKWSLMWNFPKVYRGRHLTHPHFFGFRCRTAEINSDERVPKTLDGNPFGVTPSRVTVSSRALKVIVPE